MRTRKLHQWNCRGTSTLEFIVVLPFLLFLFLAAVELSRAWMTYNVVVQAAREGARVGVVTDPFSDAPAKAAITNLLTASNLTAASVSVTCPAICAPDSTVTSTVSVNFQSIVPLMLPMLPDPIVLTHTTSMRFE